MSGVFLKSEKKRLFRAKLSQVKQNQSLHVPVCGQYSNSRLFTASSCYDPKKKNPAFRDAAAAPRVNSLFNPVIKGQGDTKDSTCDVSGVGNEGKGGGAAGEEGGAETQEGVKCSQEIGRRKSQDGEEDERNGKV